MEHNTAGLSAKAAAAAPPMTDSFSEVFDEKRQTSAQTDLDSLFAAASQQYGVPQTLLKAVAKAESNFNPKATSHCGAMGIMQLMPSTATSLGVSDAYDPEQNIMGGAKLLGQLLGQFDGDLSLALAGYNAGPGNVIKYNGIPPFSETRNYVAKVLDYCGQDISAGYVASGSPQSVGFKVSEALSRPADSDVDNLVSTMSGNLDESIKMWAYMVQNPNLDGLTADEENQAG